MTPRHALFWRPLDGGVLMGQARQVHAGLRRERGALQRLSDALRAPGARLPAFTVEPVEGTAMECLVGRAGNPWVSNLAALVKDTRLEHLKWTPAAGRRARERLHRQEAAEPRDPVQGAGMFGKAVVRVYNALERGDPWLAALWLAQARRALDSPPPPEAALLEMAALDVYFVAAGGLRSLDTPFDGAGLREEARAMAEGMRSAAKACEKYDQRLARRASSLARLLESTPTQVGAGSTPAAARHELYWRMVGASPSPAPSLHRPPGGTLADAVILANHLHRQLREVVNSADSPDEAVMEALGNGAKVAGRIFMEQRDEVGLVRAGVLGAVAFAARELVTFKREVKVDRLVGMVAGLCEKHGLLLGEEVLVWRGDVVAARRLAVEWGVARGVLGRLLVEGAALPGGDGGATDAESVPLDPLPGPSLRCVFCNIPYDALYWPYRAAVFVAIYACGYVPWVATDFIGERDPKRAEHIAELLRRAERSVHDLVRVHGEGLFNTSRGNMAFEAGQASAIHPERALWLAPHGVDPAWYLSDLAVDSSRLTLYGTRVELALAVVDFLGGGGIVKSEVQQILAGKGVECLALATAHGIAGRWSAWKALWGSAPIPATLPAPADLNGGS